MAFTPELAAFTFATLGGIAINLVRWLEYANVPKQQRPVTFSDPLYVAQFTILPILGGFVAVVYVMSGTMLSPILAINVGVSAPLILKTMGAAVPSKVPSPSSVD